MCLGTLFIKCSDRRLARLLKAAGLQRLLFSFNLLGGGSTSQHIQHGGPAWRRPEHGRTSERAGLGLSFPLHQQGRLQGRLLFFLNEMCLFLLRAMRRCDDVINTQTRRHRRDTANDSPNIPFPPNDPFETNRSAPHSSVYPARLIMFHSSSSFLPKSSCYFPEYAEFSSLLYLQGFLYIDFYFVKNTAVLFFFFLRPL